RLVHRVSARDQQDLDLKAAGKEPQLHQDQPDERGAGASSNGGHDAELIYEVSVAIPRPAAIALPPTIDRVSEAEARRISIGGEVSDLSLREDIRARADRLGVRGWVRLMEDGRLCVHAEGERDARERLVKWLRS